MAILDLSVSADGRFVFTSSEDSTGVVTDRSNQSRRILLGHTNWTRSILHLPHTPELCVTSSDDHDLRVWNFATETCVRTLKHHRDFVYRLCLHSSENIVASSSADKYATALCSHPWCLCCSVRLLAPVIFFLAGALRCGT
eukprot:m.174087 g.174087  ORF g.174087 m.174087 type:complete len:141 (+) comp53292_c0_seq3:455-877(+)